MSMGQSQESTNIDETKETIKREVLDFIAQYGCGKAPDEAFDTLAKHIFAFQFERNLPYRAYCMSKRVTPQTLANWMQIPPMPVDGFKMLTLTSVPEQDCEAVFTTSGTTHPGQRGRNFHPDLQVWDESMIVPFRHFIMPDRERIRIAVLSPAWDMNEHSALSRYLTRAVEQCGAEGSGFFFHEDGRDFTGVERFLDENPDHEGAREPLAALRAATPKPIAFEDLDFNFGERWIPTGIYDSYASWLFETEVKIGYIADLDEFGITAKDEYNIKIQNQYAVQGEFRRYTGLHLMKHALHNTIPDITKKARKLIDGEWKEVKVRDGEKIQQANI